MKKIAISTLLICAVSLPLAQADESHHPEKGKEATAASPDKGMGMMDMEKMQEMHKTMERAQQSTDPAERQRLMQEHMDQMHKMMGDMHGMMGKGMGGNISADERQQMLEKRMDMMQGMMEQMMEQMMAERGAVKKESADQGKQMQRRHEMMDMKK